MIKINNITKKYNDKTVFNDFSLLIDTSEVTILEGPSGCGKSTLIKIILGLEKADKGEIVVDEKKIGVSFQDYRLFPHLDSYHNVMIVNEMGDGGNYLSRLGIGDDVDKYPNELSGGMMQRVSIARALNYDSEYLILDEPFHALDSKTKDIAMNLVCEYKGGILLITHSEDEKAFFLKNRKSRVVTLPIHY